MELSKILNAILGPNYRPRDDEFVSPEITIWYLKRRSQAKPKPTDLPFAIETHFHPDPQFYRDIYRDVGAPWMWWERLAMSEEKLIELYADGDRLLILPVVKDMPAGFSELHFISDQVTEITYFGFKPEFVGTGLAKPFMEEVVRLAWLGKSQGTKPTQVREIQLNTCSLDHPRARGFYKSLGYEEYDQKSGPVHIPKHLLLPDQIAARR